MTITLPQMPVISVADVEVFAIDYTDVLDDAETITGTPTVAEQTTTDLTISNVSVNSVAMTILDKSVGIGKAVQFKVVNQKVNTTYTLLVTVGTTSTPARTLKRLARFEVE
jgi:hypothetical protein